MRIRSRTLDFFEKSLQLISNLFKQSQWPRDIRNSLQTVRADIEIQTDENSDIEANCENCVSVRSLTEEGKALQVMPGSELILCYTLKNYF